MYRLLFKRLVGFKRNYLQYSNVYVSFCKILEIGFTALGTQDNDDYSTYVSTEFE